MEATMIDVGMRERKGNDTGDEAMETGTITSGERLFRVYCVQRGEMWTGQFLIRTDATAAKKWAEANLPGGLKGSIRPRKWFMATLGHAVYELKVG